jgi:3-hydroxymyristoyl/3-hydroxydecanoyl-(acyl carrier protein) dehydratase
MADFNDPNEVAYQLKMIDRPGEITTIPEGQAVVSDKIQFHPELTQFDNIISWEKGIKVVAQKNVSLLASYFTDHFPRKPVLPITILLQSKLQLAEQFLKDFLGADKFIYPTRVYNIKMKDFAQSGDILFTSFHIADHSENKYIIKFRTDMNGKMVCVAEAEFVVS